MVMIAKRTHRSPAALDALRVRALQGDRLKDCTDSEREWVWRSLLKGTRRDIVMDLAGLDAAGMEHALVRIRHWYEQRIALYKTRPRVVRPVKPAPQRHRWPWDRR